MVPVTSELRCRNLYHIKSRAAIDDERCLCRVPGIVWVKLDMLKMKKTAGVEMAVSTASAKQPRCETREDPTKTMSYATGVDICISYCVQL
jgi:hypothetical protein